MKSTQAGAFVTKSRRVWLAWGIAVFAWAVFAAAEQEHQIRAWVAYHFDFEKSAANHHSAQKQAYIYRQQLLAQIDSAASAAEAQVRRAPGPLAKVGSELLEYEVAKADKEARSRKKHELTHNTGNVYTDLLNEDALAHETHTETPLPRPSNSWLLAILVPPLALALIVALVPSLIVVAIRTTRGRALVAAAILWPLIVLAWGFIFEWDNYFRSEQYIGLLILPPALAAVGVGLWQWSRSVRT